MKQLIQVRNNIFYKKTDDDKELTRLNEIVMLFDVAEYKTTNEGDVIRNRAIEECRFIVSQDSLGGLIETLEAYKNADETDLK